jgi:hypothetical protein
MKKISILLFVLLFCTNVLADEMMNKDGFLNNNVGYSKDQKISDP